MVRAWPWILAALAALVLFPDLEDPEMGYPLLMLRYLPAGVLGIVVASFVAAFMSTVSTQINWGASYLVNDLYARFVNPEASQRKLVTLGRLASVVIVAAGGVAAFVANDIGTVFRFMIAIGTGPGAVLILRWFWPRVNAWAELASMLAGFAIALLSYLPLWGGMGFGLRLAVLHDAGRRRSRRGAHRHDARHGAHGGRLLALRRPSRARFPRRTEADRPALLHQLGVAALRGS